MNINPDHIALMRKLIEQSIGHSMHSPSDFEELSTYIAQKSNDPLSISTLKRLWGYIEGYNTIRYSTLNVLARCTGYANWDKFEEFYCNNIDSNTSSPILSQHIESATLPQGSIVTVAWAPNRCCSFSCLGNERFMVIKALNSKIQPGDTFNCSQFILGEPLYIDNLTHDTTTIKLFAMGKNGGLTKIEVISKEQA